jgi:prevent-host-death family protein
MSQPEGMPEVVYSVNQLRDSLAEVIDKAIATKQPMIITKNNQPAAAIIDINVLQSMFDRMNELEALEQNRARFEANVRILAEYVSGNPQGEDNQSLENELNEMYEEIFDEDTIEP